jgi:hypothetical protein
LVEQAPRTPEHLRLRARPGAGIGATGSPSQTGR